MILLIYALGLMEVPVYISVFILRRYKMYTTAKMLDFVENKPEECL